LGLADWLLEKYEGGGSIDSPPSFLGEPRKITAGMWFPALNYAHRDGKMPLDWSQCPAVESVPGKLSGAWVLRGTRMPVSVIFENLEAGANIDDILQWFEGLDRGQVRAVIEFAARSLDQAPASSPSR
jgi:uncharacterized protein (DUF433 family)